MSGAIVNRPPCHLNLRASPSTMPSRRAAPHAPASEVTDRRDRPEVIVDFVFDRGLLHVAVANVSDVAAYTVCVTFDKSFRGLGGECEVSSLPLFRRLRFLAPRKRIETFLDSSSAYFQRREPTRIAALVTYRDAARHAYERRIVHDLSIYKDVSYLVQRAGTWSLDVSTAAVERPTPESGSVRHGNPQR